MFGIPIVTLIGYAVTYGPKIFTALEGLAPVIEKVLPLFEAEVTNGATPKEAGVIIAERHFAERGGIGDQ